MMTATATSKTIRILKDLFPEIKNWVDMLNSPARENVTLVVPPPDILSSNLETLLEPFMRFSRDEGKRFLVLVRGLYLKKWDKIFYFQIFTPLFGTKHLY